MQKTETPKTVTVETKQYVQYRNYLNNWKEIQLNIAIFGDPTSELKRTLINKLTSYGQDVDSYYSNFTVYHHKNNSNLQVWDLNQDKPINERNVDYFVSNINLDQFDLFILFRENAFTDFDQKIAEFFDRKQKKLYLVGVRDDTEIKISPLIQQKVYILTKDDLTRLSLDIIDNLTDDKMTAFVLSIDPISSEIIEKKTQVLKSRTTGVSAQSGLFGSLISGPGFVIIADLIILSGEIWFYRRQLGLTDESLDKISKDTKTGFHKIVDSISKNKYGSYVFLKDVNAISSALIRTIPALLASDAFDLLKFVPIVGTVLHGTASITASKSILIQILEELSRVAINIQNLTKQVNSYKNDQNYHSIKY